VRVEGHRHHAQPVGVCDLTSAADHVPVTQVHTVEVADDHGRATEVARELVE
jgi:hypothetical protein